MTQATVVLTHAVIPINMILVFRFVLILVTANSLENSAPSVVVLAPAVPAKR